MNNLKREKKKRSQVLVENVIVLYNTIKINLNSREKRSRKKDRNGDKNLNQSIRIHNVEHQLFKVHTVHSISRTLENKSTSLNCI